MLSTKIVINLLEKIFPPKDRPDISPEIILRHELRFRKLYIWHTAIGLLVLFGLPALLFFCSGFFEKFWYIGKRDAVFYLKPDKGLLGIATGMMLAFGLSLPIAHWLLKGFVEPDLMEIYDVWYDQHPNHPVNSEAVGRVLMWIFIPLAIFTATYFRYDYTAVTHDKLEIGDFWKLSEKSTSLQNIQAVEMVIGKIAPNGNYNPGFRYRFQLNGMAPWESPFFHGTSDISHQKWRPMIDYVLKKTNLELTEVATPHN